MKWHCATTALYMVHHVSHHNEWSIEKKGSWGGGGVIYHSTISHILYAIGLHALVRLSYQIKSTQVG